MLSQFQILLSSRRWIACIAILTLGSYGCDLKIRNASSPIVSPVISPPGKLQLLSTQRSTVTPTFQANDVKTGDLVFLLRDADSDCNGGLIADMLIAPSANSGSLTFTSQSLGVVQATHTFRLRTIHADHTEECSSGVDYQYNQLTGIITASMGMEHGCAIQNTGKVFCWGPNIAGSAGDATTTMRPTTIEVPQAYGATQIAAGTDFNCARLANSTVICWGKNSNGQMGLGSAGSTSPPTVQSQTGVMQIATGASHACALLNDSSLRCWGKNSNGQLGLGNTTQATTPTPVPGLTGVTAVAAGKSHTCAVIGSGPGNAVKCWGRNSEGEVGDATNAQKTSPTLVNGLTGVTSISAKSNTTCVIRTDSTVWCWGAGTLGQLGNGGSVNSNVPVQVSGIADAVSVSVGDFLGCAVRSGGGVRCWGTNDYSNELGTQITQTALIPVDHPLITNGAAVFVNSYGACVLTNDTALKCFGSSNYGTRGDAQPELSMGGTAGFHWKGAAVTSLAPGYMQQCASFADGQVKCWGSQNGPTFGDGTTRIGFTPISPAGLGPVSKIAGNVYDNCALMADKTVKCWGAGTSGQIGDGGNVDRPTPVAVSGLSNVDEITVGGFFACARIGGSIKCWGWNGNGELGRPGGTALVPDDVQTITNAVQISGGLNHTCAVLATGAVKCWGRGLYGSNGASDYGNRDTPIDVTGLSSVTQIVSGDDHSCALINTGNVKCWGRGSEGQLGNGSTTTNNYLPVDVTGLTGVIQLATSYRTTCALRTDGTVWCWGYGAGGNYVDEQYQMHTTPVAIAGLDHVVLIAKSWFSGTAVLSNGQIKSWGSTVYNNTSRSTPALSTVVQ